MKRLLLAVTSLLLTAGFLLSRLPLLTTRRFDGDELEHAHVAWSILQGQVPYRDFFEHHTLLFHYLLAGFFWLFDPEQSADRAFQALFAARHVTWGFSAVLVATTFIAARRWRDATTAWVALPLTAGNLVIALRAIEIRPDGLATILWLWSLITLGKALDLAYSAPSRARTLFGASGLIFGLALLTSQKLALAGPWLAAVLMWYAAGERFGGTARRRAGDLLAYATGALAVWAPAVLFFAAHRTAGDFLRLTFFEGVKWSAETTAATTLAFIVKYDPWLFALAAGGVALMIATLVRRVDRTPSNVLLLVAAGGMFAGLFLIPVPYPQYCLTFIPLFAILAATFLVQIAKAVGGGKESGSGVRRCASVAGAVAFVAVAVPSFVSARPEVISPLLYPVAAGASIAITALLAVRRHAELAVAGVLFLIAIVPAQAMRWMLELGDRGQFAELRYVLQHTEPDSVVLDGWTGYGVFRPHAHYYWMLHGGVQAMLSTDDVNGLVTDVVAERIRPDVIVLDEHVRRLSQRLAQFVVTRYVWSEVGAVYRRR